MAPKTDNKDDAARQKKNTWEVVWVNVNCAYKYEYYVMERVKQRYWEIKRMT